MSGPRSTACTSEIALLGLGSNLGDRAATLRSAIESLRGEAPRLDVLAVSAFLETDPVGFSNQPRFLNAAALARTSMTPRQLLERCLHIEREHARERTATGRWGPRTLDIDLLLFGEQVINEPSLHVPHPRFHQRLFALVPAAEIAGELRHPVLDRTIRQLLAAACPSPSP